MNAVGSNELSQPNQCMPSDLIWISTVCKILSSKAGMALYNSKSISPLLGLLICLLLLTYRATHCLIKYKAFRFGLNQNINQTKVHINLV